MKKMLDELKKLDMEYEVPQDFRKKVMSQIKAEASAEKPKQNKVIHFKKYVIACASVAAMFIVVVNVGIPSMKGLSSDLSGNATTSFDSVTQVAPSNTPSLSAGVSSLNGNVIFDEWFDGLRKEEFNTDSVANKVEIEATQKIKITSKLLKQELRRINISYEEIGEEIFIQKVELETLKDTMDEEILDGLKFIEKDDKIQIIIK